MDRTDKILLLTALKTHILFKNKLFFGVQIVIIISLEVLIQVRHL